MEGTSKSVLIKSKSSNTALRTNKTEKRTNKKSKSYGQFEPNVLKKRSVYVEKNNMNSLIENNIRGNRSATLKKNAPAAPPRPRPGSKKFLNSVLAILSQTTISTQFPVKEDEKPKNKKEKLETKTLVRELSEEANLFKQERTKKNKFRSKILNETKDEPLVLLRPRKDLGQTPSSFSQRSSRWSMSGFRTAIDNKQSKTFIQNALESDSFEAGSIAKEVMAGRNVVKKVASPLTLVNDLKLKKEHIKDEKKLYNFFVDLLETTFSIYNVTPEYDVAAVEASDVSSSKMALEIDEMVAQKLNIDKEQKLTITHDVQQKPSYDLDDTVQWNDKKLLEYFQNHSLSSLWSKSDIPQTKSCKRKIKSGAFLNARTTNRPGESRSAVMPTKKPLNKKRKNLLNMLKEQLTEVRSFEEPTTFYQALKVMARNKRKSQKSIQFVEPSRRVEGSFDSADCMFKRRRVLSNSTKSNCSKVYKRAPRTPSSSSGSELSFRKKANDFDSPTDCEADDESYHSLEVYGYDYEPSIDKRYVENQNKQIVLSGNEFVDSDYGNSVQDNKQNVG